MEIYIRNLNTNKGDWIDLDSMSDFDELDKAIAKIANGDDWEMTDTDNDSGVDSHLIKSPKDALAIVLIKDQGAEPQAISLVGDSQGGIDCTDESDVDEFFEKTQQVKHAKDKEDYVLEYLENTGQEIPAFLQGYIDTDKFFQDNVDFEGIPWSEDSEGIWVYER